MSDKPSKKTKFDSSDSETDDSLSHGEDRVEEQVAGELLNTDADGDFERNDEDVDDEYEDVSEDEEIENEIENEEEEDGFEEEFSLDQLSQAYAEVLKHQEGGDSEGDDSDDESNGGASDEDHEDGIDGDGEDDSNDAAEDLDALDNAGCPVSPESIIESILFVGSPPDVKLTSRMIAAVLRDVSPKEVTKIVRSLNSRYEKENAAFRIESDGGVFKMILDPQLDEFQQDYFGRNRRFRLSQAAIEVMAIVAYNQPTTKDQVEKTRCKPSGSVLSQLVRRDLLRVEPGEADPRIRYFSTTKRFLEMFGLSEATDLPQSHEVSDIDELAD